MSKEKKQVYQSPLQYHVSTPLYNMLPMLQLFSKYDFPPLIKNCRKKVDGEATNGKAIHELLLSKHLNEQVSHIIPTFSMNSKQIARFQQTTLTGLEQVNQLSEKHTSKTMQVFLKMVEREREKWNSRTNSSSLSSVSYHK